MLTRPTCHKLCGDNWDRSIQEGWKVLQWIGEDPTVQPC